MDSKPSIDSDKETPKRLAFSVENILDPNKFTGKKHNTINGNIRMWNSIDRDDKMDDEQSDDHSSKFRNQTNIFTKISKI
jgi:hypothetical protein